MRGGAVWIQKKMRSFPVRKTSGERTRLACWQWRPRHCKPQIHLFSGARSMMHFCEAAEMCTRAACAPQKGVPDSLASACRYCTVTSVPTGISEKNLRAVSSGNRMQPCDAG